MESLVRCVCQKGNRRRLPFVDFSQWIKEQEKQFLSKDKMPDKTTTQQPDKKPQAHYTDISSKGLIARDELLRILAGYSIELEEKVLNDLVAWKIRDL